MHPSTLHNIAGHQATPIVTKETYFYKKANHIGHILKSANCANKKNNIPKINWVKLH